MKEYERYKDSGIEWLGKVPKHWEIRRMKDIFRLKRGRFSHRPRNDQRLYENGIYPFIQTGDVSRSVKYVTDYEQTLNQDGIKVSKLFKIGTLVMTIAANIGDVAIVAFDSYFPDSLVAFDTKYHTDYYFYLLKTTKEELDTVKVTNTQDNLNLERLNGLHKLLPPISEQVAIANYLDEKTQLIDKKIELLYKKIDTYKELRKAFINKAVCQGLDDSVKLKDSGIDWIGKIPEHWDSNRLKDKFDIYTGNSISDKTFYENSTNGLPYIATKDIDIEQGNIDYENGMFIPDGKLKEFKISHKNSSLICIEGASAGKKIGFNIQNSCFVNKLCSIKSKDKFGVDKYLYYQLQSDIWTNQFFAVLNGMIGASSGENANGICPTHFERFVLSRLCM